MLYSLKDYDYFFDTPAKKRQERVIVQKIMKLLTNNKYDNIEDLIAKNQTYQDFLRKNELDTVIKHFGNTLTEQDFKNILNSVRKYIEKKKQFNTENLQTTVIGDKEYNSYETDDKTIVLDNSNSNMTIERQMQILQPTELKFQTTNAETNSKNMMNELEQNKKEAINLQYLHQINFDSLNEFDKATYQLAAEYQDYVTTPIQVDLDRKLIYNEEGIWEIRRNENGDIVLTGDDNKVKVFNKKQETENVKTFQKVLEPMPRINESI